ncbi:MAG: hypothetical protein KZQ76_14650 [Candidatus Thiodiazotropha sp. (ex Epidulcina cf. delphinae)]|nr:hypothetical protein [Candidatus Thiodiazotropha sp. (ex Epidulcina cf. delphinae)]
MTEERIPIVRFFAALPLFALSYACFATEVSADGDDAFRPARPFSAILVEYNRHSEDARRRTRLIFSEHGMRSESLSPQSGKPQFIVIQNYRTQQEWLVNPARRYFSELPEGKPVSSNGEPAGSRETAPPGVLAPMPCAGMKGEKRTARAIGETELSVWDCSDGRGRSHLQHYSTLLGLVIRQETAEGAVGELQEIALIDKPPGYFKPSSLWREVALEAFLIGAPMLPAYEE